MQSAGAGAEGNVAALGVVSERRHAVPYTRAAVHALLAVEERDAVRTGRNRLPRTHLDAHLRGAALAEPGKRKAHMVGTAAGPLHFAASQQRVLVRDQQPDALLVGGKVQ